MGRCTVAPIRGSKHVASREELLDPERILLDRMNTLMYGITFLCLARSVLDTLAAESYEYFRLCCARHTLWWIRKVLGRMNRVVRGYWSERS